MSGKKRLVIGMTGASGAPLAVEVLKLLKQCPDWESHLVMTAAAEHTVRTETGLTPEEVRGLADVSYREDEIGAAIASGTFRTEGMVVVPCSMKTAAGIACGYAENLLLRAADVTMKERRRLVLVPREAPFSTLHLRNLTTLSELGCVILPPVITCYGGARTLEELYRQLAGRILDRFGINVPGFFRWEGEEA